MSLVSLVRGSRAHKSALRKARGEDHKPEDELEEEKEREEAEDEDRREDEAEDDRREDEAGDDREDEEAEDDDDDEPSAEDGDENEDRKARSARRRERRRIARVMRHKAAQGRERMAIQLLTTTGLSSRKIVGILTAAPAAGGSRGFLAAMDRAHDPRPGVGGGDREAGGNFGWDRIVARINKRR